MPQLSHNLTPCIIKRKFKFIATFILHYTTSSLQIFLPNILSIFILFFTLFINCLNIQIKLVITPTNSIIVETSRTEKKNRTKQLRTNNAKFTSSTKLHLHTTTATEKESVCAVDITVRTTDPMKKKSFV